MPLQSCIVTHYKNSKNLYKAESNSLLYIFFIPKNGGKESANLNLLLFKKLATCRPKKQGKLAPSKFLLFFFCYHWLEIHTCHHHLFVSFVCCRTIKTDGYFLQRFLFTYFIFIYLILVFAKQTSSTKTFMRALLFYFSKYKNLSSLIIRLTLIIITNT